MSTVLQTLIEQTGLTQSQSTEFFSDVMAGKIDPALLGSVLTALKIKGETADEIAGAAIAVRDYATNFPENTYALSDCVGTGGDGANTINISTTSAILAAACGLKVAKHGNRSVSSMSGSADLLEAFGTNLMMSPATALKCIEQTNLCFLFAPAYHPGFKYAGPVRAAMGVRTLFNILGPLVNPAKPKHMLLGVYTPELLSVMAESLNKTGVERGLVVHGSGLDELAIHGESQIIEINQGELSSYTVTPKDFGLERYPLEALKGGTPDENALYTKAILQGNGQPAHNAAVIMNTAALLYVNGMGESLKDSANIAQTTLASGKAFETLQAFVEASNIEEKEAN